MAEVTTVVAAVKPRTTATSKKEDDGKKDDFFFYQIIELISGKADGHCNRFNHTTHVVFKHYSCRT